MPTVQFILDADASKVLSEQMKIILSTQKVEEGMRKWKNEAEGVSSSLQKIVPVFDVGSVLQRGLAMAVGYFKEMKDYSDAIARMTNSMQSSLTALSIMQPKGAAQQAIFEASNIAVRTGQTQTTARNVIQGVQSIPGLNQNEAFKISEYLLQASNLAMDPNELVGFLNNITRKGIPYQMAATLPYEAGVASYKTPETMIKAKEALSQWMDPVLAMASAPEVLSQVSEGEYHTYLKRAGMALHSPHKKERRAWRKLGVSADADEITKLTAMRERGINTPEEIVMAGLAGDVRELQGLQAIVENLPVILQRKTDWEAKFKADPEYLLRENLPRLRKEVPQIDQAIKQKSAEARLERAQTLEEMSYGKQIKLARRTDVLTSLTKTGLYTETKELGYGAAAAYELGLMGQGMKLREIEEKKELGIYGGVERTKDILAQGAGLISPFGTADNAKMILGELKSMNRNTTNSAAQTE